MLKDRVKDTSTTTGTGNFTLSGISPTGFQTFNVAFGTNVEFLYNIEGGSEWEIGIGILSTSTTLVRAAVLASSNAGAAVSFSAGTKSVWATMPADRLPEAIKTTTNYYACPAGQTTASYNGAGAVAVTPSDNNDGLSPTTPFATIAKFKAVIAGKIILAPVTLNLADTEGGAANKVFFPDDEVIENISSGGISAGSLGVGTSGLSDTLWPSGYVYVKGNDTTPANVQLIGSSTYNGTTSSKMVAFRVKNTNFRMSGVDLRYFKFGIVGNNSLVMVDKISGTSDNPSPTVIDASCFYVDGGSWLRVGPATTITNWVAWTCNRSTFDCRTPNGFTNLTYSSTGGERAMLMNEGSKGYWQGTTATFSGSGAYVCFDALAGSLWNFNTDEQTNITFNCANATAFQAKWGSKFGAWTDASLITETVTALGKRANAADDSYIYVGNMAAGTNADTVSNRSAIGYSASNWIGDGDVKYKKLQIENSGTLQLVSITRTDTGQLQFFMRAGGNNAWESSVWNCERHRGTNASPSVLQDGDDILTLNGAGYRGSSVYEAVGYLTLEAAGTLSSTSLPGRWNFYTVPSGSTSATRKFAVEPNGVRVGDTGTIFTSVLSASATLDFGNTTTNNSTDLTITVTGAAVGDPVFLGLPAAPDANTCFTAWVSATNTVTVRFNNYSAGSVNPASGAYRVAVMKFA